MKVGQKIKEARKAKGLTQEELGVLIGVQKSAIAKYESGRVVNIKRSTLQKLAEVLDIRGSELIIDNKPIEAAEFHAQILTDNSVMTMLEQYYELNNVDQKIVRDLVQSLYKKTEA